jgi:hypothetical protein
MKVKIKKLDGSEHQFDDVIDIKIETTEVFNVSNNNNTTNNTKTEKKKQVYVFNELENWTIDVIRETEKAFLVSNGEKQIWLPKSKFIGNRIKEKDFEYFMNKN